MGKGINWSRAANRDRMLNRGTENIGDGLPPEFFAGPRRQKPSKDEQRRTTETAIEQFLSAGGKIKKG